jgi:spore germination cell wall hydrolase CwlJ-like protein
MASSPLLRGRPAVAILLVLLAAASVFAWNAGLFDGFLGPSANMTANHQEELKQLPGKPDDLPTDTATLDAISALARNSEIPFVSGPIVPARSFRFTGSARDRHEATECLALTAMAEAGGSDKGQRAVIQVVLNRSRHPAFPSTICGVVFQGSERATGCQFTYTCDGSLARSYSTAAWQAARKRAGEALDGYVFKPVGLATHYHTNWVHPYWSSSLDKLAQVDTHLFFKWRGFWGTAQAMRLRYPGGEPSFSELLARDRAAEPAPTESSAPDPDEAAAVAAVGSLAAGKNAGETVIPHPDGGAFLVAMKPGTGAAGALAMARRLCGGNGYCRVMAWSDRSLLPRGYPIPPQARARVTLSYVLDAQNREIIEFDCGAMKGVPNGQCRANSPAAPVTEN